MKKKLSLSLCLGGLAILASCGTKGSNAPKFSVEEFTASTDSVVWCDSIGSGDMASIVRLQVEFPTLQCNASDSIDQWIKSALSQNCDPTQSMKDFVAEVGNRAMKSIKDDISTMVADGFESPMPEERLWKIDPLYISPKFATYQATIYAYLGGAHGVTRYCATTFSIPSGKEWGYDMLKDADLPKVRELVLQELPAFFGVETVGDMEPKLAISLKDVNLPETPPFLNAEGVEFVYQQYEIAPYSEGMPTCTVPYSKIMPYLTAEAKVLARQAGK